MNRTLAPAGIAHYDPRLTKPSTLLAPHGRSCRATGPCGAARCGLPAEVRCRFTMRSTDGPIESLTGTVRTTTIRALPDSVPALGMTAARAVMVAGGGSGSPAALWITAMRPRRGRAVSVTGWKPPHRR